MLTATLLLSGAVVGWASTAARAGNRRQALAALAITAGLGGAFLNLAWYTGSNVGFGPSSHAFGAIVLASLGLGAAGGRRRHRFSRRSRCCERSSGLRT